MDRKVFLTDEAAQDLAEIRRWYSQPGAGEPAKRVLQRLEKGLQTLSVFPFIGREGAYQGSREHIVSRHRIVYRVNDNQVLVIAVFGPGQNQ